MGNIWNAVDAISEKENSKFFCQNVDSTQNKLTKLFHSIKIIWEFCAF